MQQRDLPEFLTKILDRSSQLPVQGELRVDGLRLAVRGDGSGMFDWIKLLFAVWCHDGQPIAREFKVATLHSDQLVRDAISFYDSNQVVANTFYRRSYVFNRIQFGDDLFVDYFPDLGTVWVTDLSLQSVCLVYSNRTRLPAKELSLGILDVVNQHLFADNWHIFHGGAIRLGERNFMVVGNSGSGKTTLLLGLIHAKANYISNERVYARLSQTSIHVRAFPQAIGVGLGTAMHFGQLKGFIHRPDRLIHFQHKFNDRRVRKTPEDQWASLPDKIKLLPEEVIRALDGVPPSSGGPLYGMIVPQLAIGKDSLVTAINSQEAYDILSRNYISPERDDIYPRWLPLPGSQAKTVASQAIIAAISKLPASIVRFSLGQPGSFDQLSVLARNLSGRSGG